MKQLENEMLERLIERREGETASGYTAFLEFCKLPPSERSGDKCNEVIAKRVGLAELTIADYRAQNRWETRVSKIDAHSFMLEYKQRQDILSEDNRKFVEEQRVIKRDSQDALKKMLAVANNLLDIALVTGKETATGMVITKDGDEVPTKVVYEMKAKVSDIPALINTAIKGSRLVMDLPTEIVENRPINTEDLSKLTPEQLEIQLEKVRRARQEQAAQQITGLIQ